MNRTGLLVGVLFAAAACGDDGGPCQLDVCGTGCVDVNTDPNNCGACFVECGEGNFCTGGTCMPSLACTAPEEQCGDECIDLTQSVAHCGACDNACASFGECIDGGCANPLVALRTVEQSKGEIGREIYVVLDGTLAIHRIETDLATTSVQDHAVLPDGRILLIVNGETADELFVSSPLGGALTKVSGEIGKGGGFGVTDFAFSADGTKVIYRSDQDTSGVLELYVVSLAAPGVSAKVNGVIAEGGQASVVYALSANGGRATYIADQNTQGIEEIFTVDLSGATPGAPVKLNPDIGDSEIWDFQMSADGARVVYRSDYQLGTPQLYAVDVATPTVENPIVNTLLGSKENTYVTGDDYVVAADGSAVSYRANLNFLDESIFVAPLGPTFDSVLVLENGDPGTGVRHTIRFTSTSVFFRKDITFDNPKLFRVDLATPNVLLPVFDSNVLDVQVDSFAISPNGEHLVFGTGGDGGEGGFETPGIDNNPLSTFSSELYHVDLTAPSPATPTRIVSLIAGNTAVEGDYFVLDDGRVVFRGDAQESGVTDVFVGSPAMPDTPVKIGPVLDINVIQATDVASIKRF